VKHPSVKTVTSKFAFLLAPPQKKNFKILRSPISHFEVVRTKGLGIVENVDEPGLEVAPRKYLERFQSN